MTKKTMNIFQIFAQGLKIYLQNFIHMSEAVLFGVFGQLGGIAMIFVPVYYYSQNVKEMAMTNPLLNNIPLIFLILILITLPGFFVFTKAFWDYMIQMVSLNLMVEDIIKPKQLKSHKLYSQIIRLRSKDYIVLLSIIALLWLIGMMLPLVFFASSMDTTFKYVFFVGFEFIALFVLSILTIYLSLSFQVFAFENSLKPIQVLKRSFEMITNHFWRSAVLATLLFVVTGMIVPYLFQSVVENTLIGEFFAQPFRTYLSSVIPNPAAFMKIIGPVGSILAGKSGDIVLEMSLFMALTTTGIVITALMLPLGTACYALLYKDILKRKEIIDKKAEKSKKKKK